MKPFKLIAIMIVMMISTLAFGQDVPAEALPPEWIGDVLVWLQAIPKVGPILVEVLKWVSVIGTVFTALTTAAVVVLKIPEIALRVSGAEKIADKIKVIHDKIVPWFKYLSIYNSKIQIKK